MDNKFRKFVKRSSFELKLTVPQVRMILFIGSSASKVSQEMVFLINTCRSLVRCGFVKSDKDKGLELTSEGKIVYDLLLACGYKDDVDVFNELLD
jgi:hypothetical protein